jgi:hypothetical protein
MHHAAGTSARGSATDATLTTSDKGMRLRGGWLATARMGWIALTVTIVALNVIALPNTFASTANFTPQDLQALHRANFSPMLYDEITAAEGILGQLAFVVMALLLFFRRSDDRMALFGSVMLLSFGGIIGGGVFDPSSGSLVPALAASPALHVMASLIVVIAQSSLIDFFYLFPSGRFVPRWTRWGALIVVAYWVAVGFVPVLFTGPLALVFLGFLVSALVAQVYRFRRVSTPREREQTKWIVFAVVVAVLTIVVPQVIVRLLPPRAQNAVYYSSVIGNLVWGGRWNLALMLIPISIAVAILRTRLWDIDVIIRRTLIYGSLTAILAGVYFAVVLGAQAFVQAITGQRGQQP